jgi:hypothetical protein
MVDGKKSEPQKSGSLYEQRRIRRHGKTLKRIIENFLKKAN